MSNLKKLGVVIAAVFAFTAIAAATASAGTFTASIPSDNITGNAETAQVFNSEGTTNPIANRVTCNSASTSGKANSGSSQNQSVTVNYNSSTNKCNALFGTANISAASYTFHAGPGSSNNNGNVDVTNTITISVEVLGTNCHLVVAPQNGLSTVGFATVSTNSVTETSSVDGIVSTGTNTSSSNACGSVHNSGSYNGNSIISSNGKLTYDANP